MSGDNPPALQSSNDSNEQLPPAQTSVNELFDTEKLEAEDLRKTNKLDRNTSWNRCRHDNLSEQRKFLLPAHKPVSRLCDESENETKELKND